MTQQTALSLSEYIASEKKRLDEFEIWYRELNSRNHSHSPIIRSNGEWDAQYYHFSLGFQYEPQ